MSLEPVWGAPPEHQAPVTSDTPPPVLRLRDGAYAVALYIGGQLVAAAVVAAIVVVFVFLRDGPAALGSQIRLMSASTSFILFTIAASVGLVFLFARSLARRAPTGWAVLGFVRPSVGWLIIAVAALIACNALAYVFTLIAGPEVSERAEQTMAFFANTDPMTILPMAALVCVIVPLTEEIVFRAILFPAFATRLPRGLAGAASVAVFGLVHVQYLFSGADVALLMMAQVALLGGALTWLYAKSGSIWPSVTLHVLNNSWVMVVLLLWPDSSF